MRNCIFIILQDYYLLSSPQSAAIQFYGVLVEMMLSDSLSPRYWLGENLIS